MSGSRNWPLPFGSTRRIAGKHVSATDKSSWPIGAPDSITPEAGHIVYDDQPPLGVDDFPPMSPEQAEEVARLMESVPTPPPTLTIIVVGSYGWTNRGTVSDALVEIWNSHGKPPIQLVTSGCPLGAELHARETARDFGWESVLVRDEELGSLPGAILFAFIKDHSEVASKLVAELGTKLWTRVYRETTERQVSGWASR